jgi:glutathione synthase/RimK-type ligase-like ATP-grasp enzyme
VRRARRVARRRRPPPGTLTPAFVDRATLAIRIACSGPVHPGILQTLDALLDAHPDALDLRFAQACLLEDLGRPDAAARAYAVLLARDPQHRGALINAGTMAFVEGRTGDAMAFYRRAADAFPDDASAQLNLGHALAELGEATASRACYTRALAIEPGLPVAHLALARLLDDCGDPDAASHRSRAFAAPIVHVTRASSASPLRVLVTYAADGGNLVSTLFFDRTRVETTEFVAESFDAARPLPQHDAILNAVADADRSGEALAAVARIVAASGRPCINPPAAVLRTGRAAMAERLRAMPGTIVPRTVAMARADCTVARLGAAGFDFPLLLRTPGFHAGRHFTYVATPADLAGARDALPGDDVLAIAFVDTRGDDGRYRKYRMLAVDGALLPLHLAVAPAWKVHYFRGDNADRADSRALEAAYLADPRGHLGARAYAALERVRDALALDYGGIDFTIDAAGNVVVFEANASFAIYFPDDDATAAYRRPVADAAVAAVRTMIEARASGGRDVVREHGPLDHGKDLVPP